MYASSAGQNFSLRTTFRANPALQRTTLHHIPTALEPALEPWLASAAPSENRMEAANRIVESWFYGSRILDLTGGLRLRLIPRLNPEDVRTLYVEGNDLVNFDNIVDLHPECEVHITDINQSQGVRDFAERVNSPEYLGPRVHFAANVASRPDQIRQDSQQQSQHSPAPREPDAGHALTRSRVHPASPMRQPSALHPSGSSAPAHMPHPADRANVPSGSQVDAAREVQGQTPADDADEDRRSGRARLFLDLFKRKCDICHQPAKKSADIQLAERSVVHGRCLAETFPAQSNDQLEMAHPRRRRKRITLDTIEGALNRHPENLRNVTVYLEIIGRLLGQRGDAIYPGLRMQLLLRAASYLPENTTLNVGSRAYTKKDCLITAMELALQHARDSVSLIGGRLLNELPEDTQRFLINGISWDRSQIIDWSQNRSLPGAQASRRVTRALVNVERKMRDNNRQNVHDVDTLEVCSEQLGEMRGRAGELMPLSEVETAIKQYILKKGGSSRASRGLGRILPRTSVVEKFGVSIADALRIVWGYIENTRSPMLKADLKNALMDRLVEIGHEDPCTIGVIDRLLDIPTAIDFSIGGEGTSKMQLSAELKKLAGNINAEFEEQWGRYADELRLEFCRGVTSVDPDIMISEIKRDMFIAKARAVCVDQQGLDIDMVLEEIDKVFPAGMVV